MATITCPQCNKIHHSLITEPLCPECATNDDHGNPSIDIMITVTFDGTSFTAQVDDWFFERACENDLIDALTNLIELNDDGFNQLDELLRQIKQKQSQ